jgi:hypothetical protein
LDVHSSRIISVFGEDIQPASALKH